MHTADPPALQGHALFTRQAGGKNPCPLIDFTGGFNKFYAAAFDLPEGTTVEDRFGSPFNPFLNDQNFVLSVLALEELGATGNKGLIGLTTNPVIANGIAGLATSATAQATVEACPPDPSCKVCVTDCAVSGPWIPMPQSHALDSVCHVDGSSSCKGAHCHCFLSFILCMPP